MAVLAIAANAAACARRPGREEIPPAWRRDSPAVGVMGLRRAVRRPVLEMWRALPVVRSRLPGRMQARWLPRWPALGVSRARASRHELALQVPRVQEAVRERVLVVARKLVVMRAVAA
jgi:hypothetical protein